jgi:hypothetical protein
MLENLFLVVEFKLEVEFCLNLFFKRETILFPPLLFFLLRSPPAAVRPRPLNSAARSPSHPAA